LLSHQHSFEGRYEPSLAKLGNIMTKMQKFKVGVSLAGEAGEKKVC